MKVLLPLDGSDSSAQTLAWATGFLNPKRDLVYFITIYRTAEETGAHIPDAQETDAILSQAEQFAKNRGFIVSQSEWIESGDPASAICRYVHEHNLDLIVMGSHGRGLSRLLLGSVSEEVIKHTNKPVAVVRNTPDAALHITYPERLGLKEYESGTLNILLPIDDSEPSRQTLEWTLDFLEPSRSRIHLLHSVPIAGAAGVLSHELDEGERIVLRAKHQLEEVGFIIINTQVTVGDPANDICDYASENGIDQIILGAHSRGRLLSAILGSVSSNVFKRAKQPVLIFHPGPIPSIEVSNRDKVHLTHEG